MTNVAARGKALDRFIVEMPKAELHVHLEGTVQPRTLAALAERHGIALPVRDETELADFYRFRDFAHFIEIYISVCDCLREPDDFALITREFAADLARQNVRYAEVHFNPEPHVRKRGLSFADILDGMNQGRAEARDHWSIELRWIADGVRDADSGPISVDRTVEWISDLDPKHGVVALGLGGNESGGPPAQFTRAFAAAKEAGLHVVAHAGETTGSETIWATIHELGAERIGHGISAVTDPELVEFLAETRIPLELCPTSNLRTGIVPSPAAHPFRALDDAGVFVTVSSDDPPMFGTTLTDEFRFLTRQFGYGADDLERLSLNAVQASFLPEPDKQRLIDEFTAEFRDPRMRLNFDWQEPSPQQAPNTPQPSRRP